MKFQRVAVIKLTSKEVAEAVAVGLRLDDFANPVVVSSEEAIDKAGRLNQYLNGTTVHRHCWLDGLEKGVIQSSVWLMEGHLEQRKNYQPSQALILAVGSPEAYVWCVQEIASRWPGELEDGLDKAIFTRN